MTKAGFEDWGRQKPMRRILLLPSILLALLVVMPWFLKYAEGRRLVPHFEYFAEIIDSVITALLGVWILTMIRREQEIAGKYLEDMEHLSLTDPLTGLGNRRAFERDLEMALKRSQRNGTPLALLYLDIDDMKRVNDVFGHLVGDETLRALGGVLRSSSRAGVDCAYRVGGDEFVMVLTADAKGAERIAERLTESFRERSPRGSHVTSGVVAWDGEARVQQLIDDADSRMYRRKPRLGAAPA